jgi:DNA invertase Pin-like site-specific DNA recombinase
MSKQPIAFSYIRFSTPEQAKGDSLRRQTEATAQWCQRHGITLDTSTTLRDLGKSAYTGAHRRNPDRHALAAFLKLAEAGKVPKDSYLVIENLDRLSREEERSALRLWMDILDQGINIVQLHPETIFRHEKSDMVDIIRAIIELSRGHSESAIKSKRVGASWENKRRKARENGAVMTTRLPAWVEQEDGKLRLNPERAAVVRRIFHLAAAGYGHVLIVRKLNEDGVPAFGENVVREGRRRSAFSGRWTRSYVALILRDRRAVGEMQPRKQDGTPDGDPIKGYFPAAVTEAQWNAARAGAVERGRKPGRTSGKYVNLFSGLLKDARTGEAYHMVLRTTPAAGLRRVLFNQSATSRGDQYFSFPADAFEEAILSLLREIDPHEILNGDTGPDESLVLSGELATVEAKIGELEAELLKGDVAALARALRRLEEQKKDLAERLAEARLKAAHPLSESWGETQSLLSALESAPDQQDARLRLRAALRRVVEEMRLLVVPHGAGRDRLVAVQVYFAGKGRRRDYLILHRPATGGSVGTRPARWWAKSLASVARPGKLDLRNKDHAAALEKVLLKLDLDTLMQRLS